ncbi:hypothetical protein A4H97_00670 [Niastella yeongjuensis]|uniref:Uncharacterized protein n=1 Tax=Niastella yeongjuensis TaxID=354355 RepID=A0A1V9EW68_9BACT|nr:hypothetical protein [Niastella yeongjuensis]OQP50389.1 hypothetical protein A4H97_00670 [Niastella yeongjuensis]SEN36581.1 hypothetical protein SAMN05660816_00814 [Niastella yeongjuensis]
MTKCFTVYECDESCKAIAAADLGNCKVADMILRYVRMQITVDKKVKNLLESLVDEEWTGSM